MVVGMWPTLARARRLVRREPTTDLLPATAEAAEAEAKAEADPALLLAAGRGRRRVARVAPTSIAWPVPCRPCSVRALTRPDTPARLEAALTTAVERLGGDGSPRVVRQPAGVTTPEAWQIRLDRGRPGHRRRDPGRDPRPTADGGAVIAVSCLQCGTPAARIDATFCRRCGLPYGDAPRVRRGAAAVPGLLPDGRGRRPARQPRRARVAGRPPPPHARARSPPGGRRRVARDPARGRQAPIRALERAVRHGPPLSRDRAARRRPQPPAGPRPDRHGHDPAPPLGTGGGSSSATSPSGRPPVAP